MGWIRHLISLRTRLTPYELSESLYTETEEKGKFRHELQTCRHDREGCHFEHAAPDLFGIYLLNKPRNVRTSFNA